MTEQFRKAPDGQPTSNIETQLKHAKAEYYEWEKSHQNAQERLDSAEKMMNYWDQREQELEYQLRERRLAGI